jgi:hypothetical protein
LNDLAENICRMMALNGLKNLFLNFKFCRMAIFRKTGFMLFLVLMLAGRLLAIPVSSNGGHDFGFSLTSEPQNTSEIHNPVNHFYHAIEQNNSSQTFTEVHRLTSLTILSNRVAPVNYNFSEEIFIPASVNVRMLVPIFIRGHALLN